MSDFDSNGLDDLQSLIDSYTLHAIGDSEPPTLLDIGNCCGFVDCSDRFADRCAVMRIRYLQSYRSVTC